MKLCYRNGIFLPLEEVTVPVSHLALQRGVGVFDSLRTYRERPFALSEHLDRLYHSARKSRMKLPATKEELSAIIREGLKRLDGDSVIKPYFLAGSQREEDLFPDTELLVTFETLRETPAETRRRGISLLPVDFGRTFPQVKTVNYMAPYVALMAAGGSDLEVLYCPEGKVTETTSSSFFAAVDGKLVTAPGERVLSGVTRKILMDLARKQGFEVETRLMDVEELQHVQEAFITSTIKEILPVVRIGEITIGNGRPGPVSAGLRHLFLNHIDEWLE